MSSLVTRDNFMGQLFILFLPSLLLNCPLSWDPGEIWTLNGKFKELGQYSGNQSPTGCQLAA